MKENKYRKSPFLFFNLYYNKKIMLKENKVFRKCDHPDCDKEGEYRAPKNRNLDDYYWFCLKHVSEYNKSWNYYEGMSIEEIEAENKRDETWQGKTWKFGVSLDKIAKEGRLEDPFEIYAKYMKGTNYKTTNKKVISPITKKEQEALTVFNLSYPFTKDELRKKYKTLVKKHHPDLNGGSKEAEEKFKVISACYTILLKKC